jgi:sterol desaturase/sphingolipid hydroxylase (fatty acid hydroxylase superfamily)
MSGQRLPTWLAVALALGAGAAVLYAERRRPLRRAVESSLRRDLRNAGVAALSAATLRVLEKPVVEPLAALVERRRWGLVQALGLPAPLQTAAAVALMDYTLYVWHVLTHRLGFLWRFHLVHHVDLDLSATTAVRFHFAEMALSVPYRAAQVMLIGTSPRALKLWQNLLFASIVFHHSNIRLPKALERVLVRAIVTPRMHGIHHSTVRDERDANWSSGLTIWDWLHGTLRLDVPQDAVTIGVPGYLDPDAVILPKLVVMPFRPEHEAERSADPARSMAPAGSGRLFPGRA